NVQEWARIQPGSVYSALSTLTNKGHLERHDLIDGGREVAVYTTTVTGRTERNRQQGIALETVDPYAPRAFQTGLALAPLMDRETFLDHLRRRREGLLSRQGEEARMVRASIGAPPHVAPMIGHWPRMIAAEQGWPEAPITDGAEGQFGLAGPRRSGP